MGFAIRERVPGDSISRLLPAPGGSSRPTDLPSCWPASERAPRGGFWGHWKEGAAPAPRGWSRSGPWDGADPKILTWAHSGCPRCPPPQLGPAPAAQILPPALHLPKFHLEIPQSARVRDQKDSSLLPSGNVRRPQHLPRVTHPKNLHHSCSQPDPDPRRSPGDSKAGEGGPRATSQGTPSPGLDVSPALGVARKVLAVTERSSRLKWRWMSQQPPASAARGRGCHRHLSPLSGSCSVPRDALGTSSSTGTSLASQCPPSSWEVTSSGLIAL